MLYAMLEPREGGEMLYAMLGGVVCHVRATGEGEGGCSTPC